MRTAHSLKASLFADNNMSALPSPSHMSYGLRNSRQCLRGTLAHAFARGQFLRRPTKAEGGGSAARTEMPTI